MVCQFAERRQKPEYVYDRYAERILTYRHIDIIDQNAFQDRQFIASVCYYYVYRPYFRTVYFCRYPYGFAGLKRVLYDIKRKTTCPNYLVFRINRKSIAIRYAYDIVIFV